MTTYHVLRSNQGGHGTVPHVDLTGTTPTHDCGYTDADFAAWNAANERARRQYDRKRAREAAP